MLIEGENLEVLRVLQKSYYGKVKMIYIDPPYNTGNDSFVYPDDYSETLDDYQKRTGEKNADGYLNKQSLWKKNNKESGQYHSAWLSMMYPRLYLARNLLRDDGVIFISIDDNEAANLKLLCDEVFGAENFVGNVAWESKTKSQNTKTSYNKLQPKIEYGWLYKKNTCNRFKLKTIGQKEYPENDDCGAFRFHRIEVMDAGGIRGRESMVFPILDVSPPRGKQWQIGQELVSEFLERGDLLLIDGNPTLKMREYDERNEVTDPFWGFVSKDLGTAESAKKELTDILGGKHGFDTVKPVELVKKFIFHSTDENSIILDFFAGSGTTMQAVMELNLEDGGNRQCICVQMPEVLDEASEAYKAGYRTIADITRARIDKVIDKLKTDCSENPAEKFADKTTDLACVHFALAPSNFKQWRGDEVKSESELLEQMALFEQSELPTSGQRNADIEMLTELLLKSNQGTLGVDVAYCCGDVDGTPYYEAMLRDGGVLWACFAPYTVAFKVAVLAHKPTQVLMLNSCFTGEKADEHIKNLTMEVEALVNQGVQSSIKIV